jgi:hypothetical protein
MATISTTEKKISFDCNLLKKMQEKKLAKYFIMYDDLSDEFIIKFIEPNNPTSYFYIDEESALIVDTKNLVVVGLSLTNFKEEQLSVLGLDSYWNDAFEKSITRTYKTVIPGAFQGKDPKVEIGFDKNNEQREREFQNLINGLFKKIDQKDHEKMLCFN